MRSCIAEKVKYRDLIAMSTRRCVLATPPVAGLQKSIMVYQ